MMERAPRLAVVFLNKICDVVGEFRRSHSDEAGCRIARGVVRLQCRNGRHLDIGVVAEVLIDIAHRLEAVGDRGRHGHSPHLLRVIARSLALSRARGGEATFRRQIAPAGATGARASASADTDDTERDFGETKTRSTVKMSQNTKLRSVHVQLWGLRPMNQPAAGSMFVSSTMFPERECFDAWRETFALKAVRVDMAVPDKASFRAATRARALGELSLV